MTSMEARQRIMKIIADDCYQGVLDVVNCNKQSEDVTRGVIQSLCDLCYELIESLPCETEVKAGRWKTYDCLRIRDERDIVIPPDEAVRIYNDLLGVIERIREAIAIFSPKPGDEMDEYETGKFNMAEYVLREIDS